MARGRRGPVRPTKTGETDEGHRGRRRPVRRRGSVATDEGRCGRRRPARPTKAGAADEGQRGRRRPLSIEAWEGWIGRGAGDLGLVGRLAARSPRLPARFGHAWGASAERWTSPTGRRGGSTFVGRIRRTLDVKLVGAPGPALGTLPRRARLVWTRTPVTGNPVGGKGWGRFLRRSRHAWTRLPGNPGRSRPFSPWTLAVLALDTNVVK